MMSDNPNCEYCGKEIFEEHYFTDPEGVDFHDTKKCLSWIEEEEKNGRS